MPNYTTDTLVATIKRRGSIPSSQQLFTDEDIIALANDEMETTLVPQLMKVQEGYFLGVTDLTIQNGYVEIPEDAVGQKIHNVSLVDGDTTIPLTRFSIKNAEEALDLTGTGYYILGNRIIIKFNNTASAIVRIYYPRRPLQLVSMSNAGKVVNVNTLTNEITLSFVPTDWQISDTLNIIRGKQPFNTVIEATITNLSAPTIELDSVEGIQVGDYVALDGFSPIPQLPVEAHKILAQATVVKVLEAMGDREGMAAASTRLMQNMTDLLTLITPRIDDSPKRIISRGLSRIR